VGYYGVGTLGQTYRHPISSKTVNVKVRESGSGFRGQTGQRLGLFTTLLEPWVRPTAVALLRLRRLLLSQRFTDREVTGVLIVILVDLPMNGFTVDIIVCNNIALIFLVLLLSVFFATVRKGTVVRK